MLLRCRFQNQHLEVWDRKLPHHKCNSPVCAPQLQPHIPRPRPLKQLCPAEWGDDGASRQPQFGLFCLPSPLLLHPCWRRSWSCWSSPQRGHQQGHQQQMLQQQHVTGQQQQEQHAAASAAGGAAASQVAASNSMLLAPPPAPAH